MEVPVSFSLKVLRRLMATQRARKIIWEIKSLRIVPLLLRHPKGPAQTPVWFGAGLEPSGLIASIPAGRITWPSGAPPP